MKNDFNLAADVAQTYGIARGTTEKETVWLARVIYSLLGQSALSSLWDLHEDELPTSIERFKERITITRDSCTDLYPEIEPFLLDDYWGNSESASEEIYNIYLSAGCCYKSPRRLSPAMRCAASGNHCTFLRGYAVGEPIQVSGLGAYVPSSKEQGPISISDMFQLSDFSLGQGWKQLIANRKWEVSETGQFEFLRLEPPFTQGYWYNKPNMNGDISLARTTSEGTHLYYLYKFADRLFLLSQLPEWMVDAGAYRSLSNICLNHYGVLPSTKYRIDGPIAYLQLQYLYPPAEQNLIRLYSWPDFDSHQYSFRRVMDTRVFQDIKAVLEITGYQFEEA